jgi:small subunit ribosomal protein SAe
MSQVPACLSPSQDDVQKMLACQVHMGTKNCNPEMFRYVWKRRVDGVYILNLAKTWEKLVLAARIVVAVENPQDICVISARPYGQRAVLKFAGFTGVQAISGRFTPGTFTNQIQDKFIEPRLLIVTDPIVDHQPIREASYVNLPTIAFANADASLRYVDVAIPANNRSRHSIGLLWWLLAREVLYLRSTISRTTPWDVMVDLFFYRDPEDDKASENPVEEAARLTDTSHTETAGADGWPADSSTWDNSAQPEWGAGNPTDWGSVEPGVAAVGAPPPASSWDTSITAPTWDAAQATPAAETF